MGRSGLPGPKGQKGSKGDEAERNGGAVYVRWGHNQCPSTAELVYNGRAGGSKHDQGSGSNTQCLPHNPTYHATVAGTQGASARKYGSQYHSTEMYMNMMSNVQYVMSLNVLQSTWFQQGTRVL